MNYTAHRYDPKAIAAMVVEKRANLKANRGLSDLAGFAMGVISDRVRKDPMRYRDYGPYWPAVRRLLIDYGKIADLGEDWPEIRAAYSGETAEETIVMAEEFRTWNLSRNPVYHNRFTLDADGTDEDWILEDPIMEGRED